MQNRPPTPVTQILDAISAGDPGAHERLWTLVYDELRSMAGRQMAGERPGRTLQPTALVHEAYFRLIGDGHVQWSNRGHFFSAAAKAMRRIRIDDARRRNRLKRGAAAGTARLEGDAPPAVFDDDPAELLGIDEALHKLEQSEPRQAEIVDLRYFAGLTIDETAEAIGVSPKTVDNDWRFARAWLHRELGE